jgi:hypothetical protein
MWCHITSLLYYNIELTINAIITLISYKTLGYKPVFKNKIKKENRVYWTKAFISLEDRPLLNNPIPLLYPLMTRDRVEDKDNRVSMAFSRFVQLYCTSLKRAVITTAL